MNWESSLKCKYFDRFELNLSFHLNPILQLYMVSASDPEPPVNPFSLITVDEKAFTSTRETNLPYKFVEKI